MTVYRPVADPAGGEAGSTDHSSCGRLAAAAILRTYAEPVGLTSQLIPDNATAQQIADGINAYGRGWHAEPTPWGTPEPLELAKLWIPQDRWVVNAFWCTPDAEPAPHTAADQASHWVVTYLENGTVFNCWHQTFPDYDGQLDSCYHGYGSVIVWHDPKSAPPQGVPPMGGAFQPGTHVLHWATIRASDKSVDHWFWDVTTPVADVAGENLGGTVGASDVSVAWSPDGQVCTVMCIGDDGATVCVNTWNRDDQKWDGWTPLPQSKTLQIGVPAPMAPHTHALPSTTGPPSG